MWSDVLSLHGGSGPLELPLVTLSFYWEMLMLTEAAPSGVLVLDLWTSHS